MHCCLIHIHLQTRQRSSQGPERTDTHPRSRRNPTIMVHAFPHPPCLGIGVTGAHAARGCSGTRAGVPTRGLGPQMSLVPSSLVARR